MITILRNNNASLRSSYIDRLDIDGFTQIIRNKKIRVDVQVKETKPPLI